MGGRGHVQWGWVLDVSWRVKLVLNHSLLQKCSPPFTMVLAAFIYISSMEQQNFERLACVDNPTPKP